MKSRILTSIIGIPVLVAVIFFSHTLVLPVAVAFFCVLGVWEMLGCLGFSKVPSVTVPSLIYAAIFSVITKPMLDLTGNLMGVFAVFGAVSFAFTFYLLCTAVVSKGKKEVGAVALVAVTTSYIVTGFISLLGLRSLTHETLKGYGMFIFVLVFVGAWGPDIAAYFGGRFFGKHKLIPDVSPKKTVEGAISGIAFGPVSFIITGLVYSRLGYGSPNYLVLAIAGALVAVVSIFGDLIASLIKRKYGIKDYGKLFPGHGGVMDRFDSIIAIAPFMLIICAVSELAGMFV